MTTRGWATLVGIAGAFAGGVITGMLIAPKSGRENRESIKRGATEATHKVKNVARDLKKNFPDLYEATGSFTLSDEDVLANQQSSIR
jgi:gas vesicle protein